MRRITIGFLALAISATALAQRTRTVRVEGDKRTPEVSGSTVTGFVTGVSGPIIQLANGAVQIDTSGAKIVGDVSESTLPTITTGSLVLAVIKPGDVAPGAPLQATVVTVTRPAQVTLTGSVTSVDTANSRFVILGRTVQVNSSTRGTKLSDLKSGVIAIVEANNSGGSLVASSVQQISPQPMPATIVHGNVKSIGASSWVITDKSGKDVTVIVNSQTKIAGSPAVGDIVDVIVSIDNANQYIAIVIARSLDIPKPR